MKVRRKEVLDCFYLTKDNVDEFVKWCWDYIRICDTGGELEHNIVKEDRRFYVDWFTCSMKHYFDYNKYYVIYAVDHEFEDVHPCTKKEFEEEFEVIE